MEVQTMAVWRSTWAVMVIVAASLGVCGCEREAGRGERDANAPLRVVTTTAMIADAARAVGGSRVEVSSLMGEGVDPHLYKASPGDIRQLSGADLVLFNGLHLEGRMGDVLTRLESRTPTVRVTDRIAGERLREPPEFEGESDPHVWFDVGLWISVVDRVREALITVDPEGESEYRAGADGYLAQLRELDSWVRSEMTRIPEGRRVLVTAHDAFGYFGDAYGIEVLGVQGISTDSEASIRDINSLVDTLVARRVPAVFIESSVPQKTVQALVEGCRSRGHNVVIGGELFSDAMGPSGTPEGTYIGMIRHNVRTITAALVGSEEGAEP